MSIFVAGLLRFVMDSSVFDQRITLTKLTSKRLAIGHAETFFLSHFQYFFAHIKRVGHWVNLTLKIITKIINKLFVNSYTRDLQDMGCD